MGPTVKVVVIAVVGGLLARELLRLSGTSQVAELVIGCAFLIAIPWIFLSHEAKQKRMRQQERDRSSLD